MLEVRLLDDEPVSIIISSDMKISLSSLSRSVHRVAVGQSELNIFWASRRLFMLVTNDRLVVDDLIWHEHEVYLTWVFLFKSNDKSYDFTTFVIFRLGVRPKRIAVWSARTADIRYNSFSLGSSKEKRRLNDFYCILAGDLECGRNTLHT